MTDDMTLDSNSVIASIASTVAQWNGIARFEQTVDDRYLLVAEDGEVLFEGGENELPQIAAYVQEWNTILSNGTTEQSSAFNQASPSNSRRRGRPGDPAVAERRERLIEIVDSIKPATVRQCFYAMSVRGFIEKTEGGYDKIQNDLTLLRRDGRVPYGSLADSTRWQRKPRTFTTIEAALENTANFYRKALWDDADSYVEAWLEKDALAGVVYPVTARYDVPLMVARGYASLSFLHEAAEYIAELEVPAYIYHLGDYDPSGQDAATAIERTLREMAPEAEIYFERLAVTPEQIEYWKLPSRPTKKTDTRANKFGSDISVELDAIPPDRLRQIVEDAIERHLPKDQLHVLLQAEKSERAVLGDLVRRLRSNGLEARP